MIRTLYKTTGFILLGLLLILSTLSGCSSSGGSSGETGDVSISLTDATGDFSTYIVDVTSITLTKANGTVVETVPFATTIDFAQYVDVTEFLTSASIPLGAYTKATMTLDYTNADIRVENSNGDIVPVSSIKDSDGNVITQLTVSVFLENSTALVVAPGLVKMLSLDFDLKASNTVTFDSEGNAQLVVDPTLLATIDKESPKIQRARGLLGEVSVDNGYFYLDLCPFYHKFKQHKNKFGKIMVLSGTDTTYSINGTTYQGAEGLNVLSTIDADTPVIVKGTMKYNPRRFEATDVYVGNSVPGVGSDAVVGNIISRSENTLRVNGVIYTKDYGVTNLNDTAIVTLSSDTVVTKQKSDGTFSIDDLAPGQRVSVYGGLSYTKADTPSFDATAGKVDMLMTRLRGHVVSTDTTIPQMNINLGTIDMRDVSLFDFTGTGTSVENDADPANYEIFTGSLGLSAFSADDPIMVYGFTNTFGQAPYDFKATTLVNYDSLPTVVSLKWAPATTSPFSSITDTQLVVNLTGSHLFPLFCKSGFDHLLGNTVTSATIVPDSSGAFIIVMKRNTTVYTNFADFTAKLSTLLDGNNAAKRLFGSGVYDSATHTFTATYLSIELK